MPLKRAWCTLLSSFFVQSFSGAPSARGGGGGGHRYRRPTQAQVWGHGGGAGQRPRKRRSFTSKTHADTQEHSAPSQATSCSSLFLCSTRVRHDPTAITSTASIFSRVSAVPTVALPSTPFPPRTAAGTAGTGARVWGKGPCPLACASKSSPIKR
jgi:hypothetical protein